MTAVADGQILVERRDRVCTVVLNRPEKLNAFSPAMFAALEDLGAQLRTDPTARVVVFRGAGGRALAAGADIAAFTQWGGPNEAVAYEAGVARALAAVSGLPQVSIAVIEGLAVGGGLALATACDLRIATAGARIGYPIAATLGNCLSAPVLRRCVEVFGDPLVREMVLTATLLTVERAHAAGAVLRVLEPAELEEALAELTDRVAHLAPGTQLATKRILDALGAGTDPDDERYIRTVYGSDDFRAAVRSFLAKEKPTFSAELYL